MKVQYVMFMMFFFVIFVVSSVVLIPVAYVVCIFDKLKTIDQQPNLMEKIKNNFSFLPFGLIILSFDVLADMFYFWKNNFRPMEDLKQIIIIKEKSTISHKSIREIQNNCVKYNMHKIKTVNTATIVKNFSKQLDVMQNLQFLMFGQFIPIGGFADTDGGVGKGYTLKTMKTAELEEQRMEELRLLDDSIQKVESQKHL